MSNIYSIYKYLSENHKDNKELESIKPATFYKYLNLFKKAGFDIIRLNKVHRIVKYTNSIKLSDAEMGLIAYLKLLSFMLFPKIKNKVFNGLIEKMLKYTTKEAQIEIENKFNQMKRASDVNLYREKLEIFEKFKNTNSKVIVLTKSREKQPLVAKDVIFKNKKIYFSFMDNKNREIKQIDINKIVNITPFEEGSMINYEAPEIIFELYGRLAKIYLLKEGERVVDCQNGKLTVANATSDRDKLFKRLLRYDSLCKVRFPQKDAEEFKKLIEKSLENINSLQDNMFKRV